MTIAVEPLHPLFGAEIKGVDIAAGVDAATFGAVRAAFEEYSVLLFRGQRVDDEIQIAFSERFGPLEKTVAANPARGTVFARQSNIDMDSGAIIAKDDRRMKYQAGNYLWHSDSSFKQVPSLCSILSTREVPPEGGNTEFVSTRAAYDLLPDERKAELEGLVVEHSLVYSRGLTGFKLTEKEKAELPTARQILVRANPVNGRKGLMIGAHAARIVGWPEEKGRALLDELLALATRPEACYSHAWRDGDLIVWDNRCCLHRATPYDSTRYRRLMQRTTVAGEGPTV